MMCWLCIVPAMLCMRVALSAATAVRLLCSQSRLLHPIAETATDLMFHTVWREENAYSSQQLCKYTHF